MISSGERAIASAGLKACTAVMVVVVVFTFFFFLSRRREAQVMW